MLGISDDTFVILTVADNQERKNLSKSLEIVSDFIKNGHPDTKYILVTREHNQVGWLLRDYAQVLGMNDKLMIFERGMDFKKLWSLYAASDVFLLTSKAEGLGLPLLEAMSVGIPCLATNCTAIKEVLGHDGSFSDGEITRGFIIDYDYIYTDPFGNGNRYLASREIGVKCLNQVYEKDNKIMINNARKWVEARKWDIAVDQLERALLQLNEQKTT